MGYKDGWILGMWGDRCNSGLVPVVILVLVLVLVFVLVLVVIARRDALASYQTSSSNLANSLQEIQHAWLVHGDFWVLGVWLETSSATSLRDKDSIEHICQFNNLCVVLKI